MPPVIRGHGFHAVIQLNSSFGVVYAKNIIGSAVGAFVERLQRR
jgi:hypothetical protein